MDTARSGLHVSPSPSDGADEAPSPQAAVLSAACPSRVILNHVTSRWGVLVLLALRGGTQRFSELRRKIEGVSEKMLAQTLQQLEHDGFVSRVSYPVVPPHVEYSLSALGEGIGAQVESLTSWIEAHLPQLMQAQQK